MADDWDLSEEDYARLEREARIQLSQQKTSSETVGQISRTRDAPVRPTMPAIPPSHQAQGPPARRTGVRAHNSKALLVNVFKVSGNFIGTKSSYHQGLKDALKAVEGSSWNSTERYWKFPESCLQRVLHVIGSVPELETEVQLSADLYSSPYLNGMTPHTTGASGMNMPPNRDQEEIFIRASHPGTAVPPELRSAVRVTARGEARLQEAQPISEEREPTGHVQLSLQQRMGSTSNVALHSSSAVMQSSRPQPRQDFRRMLVKPYAGGRVIVTFKEHKGLMDALGLIDGASQLGNRSRSGDVCWILPFPRLHEVQLLSSSIEGLTLQVEELPPIVHRVLQDFSRFSDESQRFDQIPEDLRTALMPFQKEGILFGLQRSGRMLCADEMGLGKTVQAIGLAACFREDWPVLVIVPSSLRLHWAMSVARWLGVPPFKITVLVAPSSCTTSREGFDFKTCTKDATVRLDGIFNIVSYELADRVANNFEIVIADESHYLKNYKAKRTAVCCPKLQNAKRAILLTGTPALARPIDLYKQLESLQPGPYRSMAEYGGRYCQGGFFGQYNGSSNMDELHSLLSSTIMIRRLKKDVLPQLPPKFRQQIMLMLSEKAMVPVKRTVKQLREVQKLLKACVDRESDDARFARQQEQALIGQLYRETAEAKLDAVMEFLNTLLEARTKFLVFAHHHVMIEGIERHMIAHKEKPGFIKIDGTTPHDKRQDLIETFQKDSNVTVAILAIRAAGVGLTLTEASTVVFAELAWNPGELVQAEDRAHRIGQEKSVNVYFLHAPDTADDILWTAVQHKLDVTGKTLDGQEKVKWSLGQSHHGVAEDRTRQGGAQLPKGQMTLDFPVTKKHPLPGEESLCAAPDGCTSSTSPRKGPACLSGASAQPVLGSYPGSLELLSPPSEEGARTFPCSMTELQHGGEHPSHEDETIRGRGPPQGQTDISVCMEPYLHKPADVQISCNGNVSSKLLEELPVKGTLLPCSKRLRGDAGQEAPVASHDNKSHHQQSFSECETAFGLKWGPGKRRRSFGTRR